jgi:hypothetical protein
MFGDRLGIYEPILALSVLDEVVHQVAEGGPGREPGVEQFGRERLEIDHSKDLVHHEQVGRRAAVDNRWLMTHAPAGLCRPEVGL